MIISAILRCERWLRAQSCSHDNQRNNNRISRRARWRQREHRPSPAARHPPSARLPGRSPCAFLVVLAYNALPAPLYSIYRRRDGFSSLMSRRDLRRLRGWRRDQPLFTAEHLFRLARAPPRLFVPALLLGMLSAAIFLAWRALPGLILARFIGGLGVGMVTATATAWIAELQRTARPGHTPRRAQVVSTAANLGGIGVGPLVGGVLAQWVRSPLTVPYVVSLIAMAIALICVLATPETRAPVRPRPRWRPQRVAVPADAVGSYLKPRASAPRSHSRCSACSPRWRPHSWRAPCITARRHWRARPPSPSSPRRW